VGDGGSFERRALIIKDIGFSFNLKLYNLGQDLEDRLWIPNHPDPPIWFPDHSPSTSKVLLDVPSPSIVDLIELQSEGFNILLILPPTQEQLVVLHPVPKKTTRSLFTRGLNNILNHSGVEESLLIK